jgi:hypothetical protein
MISIPHKILFGYVWKTREVHTGFRCGTWEKEALGRPRRGHENIILKWIFKKWDWSIWTGLICLWIAT